MTNEPPTEDLIRYDVMVQEALLGVVRKVLQDAARVGLPGEHHFYITFRSQAPGVRLSNRLREKHPEEMTIVLQHQFWDLIIGEQSFEVGLSFGGVPERLVVPYEALTGFYDPSVQFGLKFTPDETEADNDLGEGEGEPSVADRLEAISTFEKAAKPRKSKTKSEARTEVGTGSSLAEAGAGLAGLENAKSTAEEPVPVPVKKSRGKANTNNRPEAASADPEAGIEKPVGGAEVVSLEAFRKKK